MLNTLRTAFLALAACAFAAPAVAAPASADAIPAHPRELKFEPLQFERPRPQRHVLKNGMVVYLFEDHDLPIVTGIAKIRTGRIHDPEEKIGLAELTGTVLRTGGAGERSGDEINAILERLGASIESDIATQEGNVALWSQSKDLDQVLALLADILRRPRFAEDKIELKKQAMAEDVRRMNDQPGDVVEREFKRLVYASSLAWARVPSLKTVAALSREDAAKFYEQFYHPNQIIAGFAGDFDSRKLLARLEDLFGDWPRKEIELPKLPPVAEVTEPSVNYIFKDIPQSYIVLGHTGMRRHDPQRYAAAIMNHILGAGGFTSRLTAEVRSNRGLAYSVGAYLGEDTDRGTFQADVQTKAQSTWEAIGLITDIVARMATDPITDEEMERAKSSIINRFVFRFDTPQDVVREQVYLEYYGFTEDYLDHYIERISAVTKEDVRRVAKTYLHPDRTIIVVVGNERLFDKAPEGRGKPRQISLEIQ